jgi:1-deoxy-D-xylulose-5-phosphate reductoisomerase
MSPEPSATRWPRRIAVLGSTGVIGRAALDVISRLSGRLTAYALAAGSNVDRLAEQTLRFRPEVVALARADLAPDLLSRIGGAWGGTLLTGEESAAELAGLSEVDVVLNGLVGAAGLRPTWRAVTAGKRVALANKESLVIAGGFLTSEAHRCGGTLIPVDSEHSGLFQCLDGRPRSGVSRIILTASGGPFRARDLASFSEITPEEALRHPTWSMGPRITIDSATLLNKGFEVLEAHWLFALEAERIEVWIHPQSIVHGLVEWVDGSTVAQLSVPDMRIPVQFALCHPERVGGLLPGCDLTRVERLEFFAPESARYPCLGLARRALEEDGTAPAVLNAADEVIVSAFLEGRIPFPEIACCLERVLDARPTGLARDIEAVLEADRWARREAARVVAAVS